jgi:hypothetical protein
VVREALHINDDHLQHAIDELRHNRLKTGRVLMQLQDSLSYQADNLRLTDFGRALDKLLQNCGDDAWRHLLL